MNTRETDMAPSSREDRITTFTVALILSKTWFILRQSFSFFLLMGILATIPLIMYNIFAMPAVSREHTVLRHGITILSEIPTILFHTALLIGVFQILHAQVIDAAGALRLAIRYLPRVFIVSLAFTLPYLIVENWGVLINFAMQVIFICAIPCCIVEQTGCFRSWIRAYELSKGYRLKILVVFLLFVIAASVSGGLAYFVISFLAGVKITDAQEVILVTVTAIPFVLCGGIMEGVCYHTLRTIKDGVKQDILVNVFD